LADGYFFADIIIKSRDHHLVEVFTDLFCGIHPLGAHQPVDKQHRLDNLQVKDAECPEPYQPKFRILKGDWIPGSPF